MPRLAFTACCRYLCIVHSSWCSLCVFLCGTPAVRSDPRRPIPETSESPCASRASRTHWLVEKAHATSVATRRVATGRVDPTSGGFGTVFATGTKLTRKGERGAKALDRH
ncbi:hypothetical protein EDB86DRAFT_2946048 [Lactarius hatsudake]|nr:hypothetical protein EDB86DRAFT_2946048 [Lactarius hatsudake]